ncbi:MAG: hypothetical protein IJH41_03430 [Eubacterium sp.]|nr:hypothetical protein [Eubacterium sp.]
MLEFLVAHYKEEKASFHMPGHKGSAFFARLGYGDRLARIVDHDITEVPGADDLRHPEGIIKTITDRYAAIYGSKRAFISVNGSSALIMAAIKTCVKPGRKLLAAADSHISVKNGADLAGAEIIYVKPQALDPWATYDNDSNECMLAAPGSISGVNDGEANCYDRESKPGNSNSGADDYFSIPGGLSAESVAEALDKDPEIDAVILPSPNYFGVVSGIKAIADAVHARGKVLIVDQAHGAHLKMFADAGRSPGSADPDTGAGNSDVSERSADADDVCGGTMPVPAEERGADIVIVSTHKTLASFTQTAVSNVFSDLIDQDEYERNLLMLESTSPSYILMESLALNAEIMGKHGRDLARTWRADLDWFYEQVKTIPVIRVITRDSVTGAERVAAIAEAQRRTDQPAGNTVRTETEALAGSEGEGVAEDFVKNSGTDFDDSKIVVDFSGIGITGKEAEEILIDKGIFPEFYTGSVVMFLTGIGNVRHDYEVLLDALAEMAWRDIYSGWE